MASPWNSVSLQAPPLKFCTYNEEELTFIADRARKVLCDVEFDTIIAPRSPLCADIILFCRLVYKTTNFFRHDKQQRSNMRVRKCLNRFLGQDLFTLIRFCCIQMKKTSEPSRLKIRLPTQQYVQYVLVRLQGCSALICRTLVDLEATFCHGHVNLRNAIGQYFSGNFVLLACCARLWTIFKVVLIKCINLYTSLNELVDDLKPGKEEWIPDLQLPRNLKEWLATLSEDNTRFLIPAKHARILDKGSETKLLNKIFPSNNTPTKELEEIDGPSSPEIEIKSEIDLGAVVSRKQFEKEFTANDDVPLIQEPRLPPLKKKLKDVNSKLALKKFLKEDIRRRKNKEHRYTSHMSTLQRKTFIQNCRELLGKSKVNWPVIQKKIAKWLHRDTTESKTKRRLRVRSKKKSATQINGSNKP